MSCGWDWGSAKHGLCLIDDNAAIPGWWMIGHNQASLTGKFDRLADFGDLDRIPVAIGRGGDCTGYDILSECVRLRSLQSMGRVASALGNSVVESFNSTLKTEFVHRRFFATRTQAP